MKNAFSTFVLASLLGATAFANNNNSGEIEVEGVVPGLWELTVSDINDGYDFNLTDISVTSGRVGTIHVYSNGSSATTIIGHLRIESANSGRLINSAAGPSIASDNQKYGLTLTSNTLATDSLTTTTLPSDWDLVVPSTVDITGSGDGDGEEETFDVTIVLGEDRPEATGVYTDTITFTIMDN